MEKTNKRSSISEKAKNVIMELFTILFNLMVSNFQTIEINEEDLTNWERWKEKELYNELELIEKNPVRIKIQEYLDNFSLTIDNIEKMGNIQTINLHGIYDESIRIEGVILVLVENGKMTLVGHRILKFVRMRKR